MVQLQPSLWSMGHKPVMGFINQQTFFGKKVYEKKTVSPKSLFFNERNNTQITQHFILVHYLFVFRSGRRVHLFEKSYLNIS